ncbi:hypothetical protein [Rubritalea sp.]
MCNYFSNGFSLEKRLQSPSNNFIDKAVSDGRCAIRGRRCKIGQEDR